MLQYSRAFLKHWDMAQLFYDINNSTTSVFKFSSDLFNNDGQEQPAKKRVN